MLNNMRFLSENVLASVVLAIAFIVQVYIAIAIFDRIILVGMVMASYAYLLVNLKLRFIGAWIRLEELAKLMLLFLSTAAGLTTSTSFAELDAKFLSFIFYFVFVFVVFFTFFSNDFRSKLE